MTVNSSQEDTQELVTIAAVLKDLVRVQTPDPETRLKIVSNTINVVANMEGWAVSSGKAVLIIPHHPQDPLKALLQPTDLAHPAVRDKHHRDIVVNVLDCFLDLLSHK